MLYPCFKAWFEKNYSPQYRGHHIYRSFMRKVAQFARSFGVQDFEEHSKSRFIQEWFGKTVFNVFRTSYWLDLAREVQDAGLAIVACDVASRVLPRAFQTKSSMLLMIQTRILTCDPIQSTGESFRAAKNTLLNSHLLVLAFRAAGSVITSFLRRACLVKAAAAFKDSLEVSWTFSITKTNVEKVRSELTRGFPEISLGELSSAVGAGLFDCLLMRAAMFCGHTNSIGIKAVKTELKLRMEPGAAKREAFKRVTGKVWSGAEEDFTIVRDAELELVDAYLEGRFLGKSCIFTGFAYNISF
jgi:hypothetical protein